ncbi:MAG: hypothetical protein ACYTGW_02015 [Planctomycetota bacterium]|jgi:hypothetical protein
MNRHLYLSVCLAAAAPLSAQGGTIVSPAALANVEGNNGAYYLGGYSNSRFQYAEGELRGKALSITEVAFRLDGTNHNTSTAMGRKWTQVTLHVADTDWTKMTSTFSKNALTTPVQVFNSAVAWPSKVGTPFFIPTAFGAPYAFPFKSPHAFSGKSDLLLDFRLSGGTMDNAAAWSTSRFYGYYLDGNNDNTTYRSKQTLYPATIPNPRCRDSAITSNQQAHTFADLYVYGDTYSNVAWRGQVRFVLYSYYTAPNARVIAAIGFAGHPKGINLGANCNPLFVNLNVPWFALGRTTINSSGYSGSVEFILPWQSGMANVPVWVQSAWADSKTNAFSLTRAMSVVFPKDRPWPARKVCVYHYTGTAKNGYGPNIGTYYLNPVMRVTHK